MIIVIFVSSLFEMKKTQQILKKKLINLIFVIADFNYSSFSQNEFNTSECYVSLQKIIKSFQRTIC